MTRATRNEKMQMTRLAAVIERLHGDATDPATGEEVGREMAAQLGATILRNIELVILALRSSGK
jgi:hypothetical protein